MSMIFTLLNLSAPEKLNMEKIIEMSFLYHSRLRRSDAYEEHGNVSFLFFFAWNMGMSFFVVCPYIFLICAPKIGMNRTGIVLSSFSCNSSRFSRPCTHSYIKGIPQKKTSPCSSYALLFRKRAYNKKASPCYAKGLFHL